MKRNILAVCDCEQEYLYHLIDYLSTRKAFPFEVQAFTDPHQLEKFAEHNPVQVLLIAEPVYRPEMRRMNIENLLLLNESGYAETDEMKSIYKYQSSENIIREIMELVAEKGKLPKIVAAGNRLQLVGIYTPAGRCLQTTFAFVLGQMLGKKHRVLYLNFESCSGLGKMLNREFSADITDLMYFLHNAKDKFIYKLLGMVQNVSGMDFIPPAFSPVDLSMITGEEWLELLKELENGSDYEYVIMDLSDSVQGLYELLRCCDRVYTIVREDGFALAKISQYEEILKYYQFDDILTKTRKCKFPKFRKLPAGLAQSTLSELAEHTKKIIEEDFG